MNDAFDRLIAALHDQAAAVRELAESNRQVVDLVLTPPTSPADSERRLAINYLDDTATGE